MKRSIILLFIVLLPAALFSLNIYSGANLMSYGDKDELKSAQSLNAVKSFKDTGLNTLMIVVTWFQDNAQANSIYPLTAGSWQTPSDAALKEVVDYARDLNLKTGIKLHINCINGDYRGNIFPGNFSSWGNSNRDFVLKYAEFCQENNVDLFIINNELSAVATNQYSTYWNSLIDKVRDRYNGLVSYAENWDKYRDIDFWNSLDFISISAYFPLYYGNTTDKEKIKQTWKSCDVPGQYYGRDWLQELKNFSLKQDKQIVFSEIGYQSRQRDDPARSVLASPSFWTNPDSGSVGLEIQAKAYSVFIDTFIKQDWFDGFFLWEWQPDVQAGGWNDMNYTPQNKPAQDVLRSLKYYAEDLQYEPLEILARPEKIDYQKDQPVVFRLLAHEQGEMVLTIYDAVYDQCVEKKVNFNDEQEKSIVIKYSEFKSKIIRGVYHYCIKFNNKESKGKFVIIK